MENTRSLAEREMTQRGEAFDKVARAIGLGYPGGPKIEKVSHEGNPHAMEFPRAKIEDGPYDFSFSGLKSAVLNYINGCNMKGIEVVQLMLQLLSRKRSQMCWLEMR